MNTPHTSTHHTDVHQSSVVGDIELPATSALLVDVGLVMSFLFGAVGIFIEDFFVVVWGISLLSTLVACACSVVVFIHFQQYKRIPSLLEQYRRHWWRYFLCLAMGLFFVVFDVVLYGAYSLSQAMRDWPM